MDGAFSAGPMAVWLKRLWEALLNYDLLAVPEAVVYVSEKTLAQEAKQSGKRMQPLRSKHRQTETGRYFSNARQLGLMAKKLCQGCDTPLMAVFVDAKF